jgi:prepilin-type N-terminal cleavage/methylation domain-containing protein/prepilin-type processing-associated H-X9-DG protein
VKTAHNNRGRDSFSPRKGGNGSTPRPVSVAAGFTLIELLVVIAIIGILASLLFPAIARGKAEGQRAVCINNFRQLHLAWHLYIDDNDDTMPMNQFGPPMTGLPGTLNWVGGWFSPQRVRDNWLDNTNVTLLLNVEGGIGSYLKETKVFKCPSDRSVARIGGVLYSRVRSVAMNHHMGSPYGDGPDSSWDYQKLADVQAHSPRESGVVFIDTHEDSVATGMFLVAPLYYPAWEHFPASRHNGAATLSFTDGHVICRRWTDSRTRRPATGYWLYGERQPGNPDIRWLQDASTVVKRPEYVEQ